MRNHVHDTRRSQSFNWPPPRRQSKDWMAVLPNAVCASTELGVGFESLNNLSSSEFYYPDS